MSCSSPITILNKKTKQYIQVPCGQCMCCRVKKSYDLSSVLEYEQQKAYKNGLGCSFVTLTYNMDTVPISSKTGLMSLRYDDFRKFRMRINKKIKYDLPQISYKYVACGEYGDQFNRPHYHIIFLGLSDVLAEQYCRKEWRSQTVGLIDVGVLRQGGLSYVSKYMTKSVNGQKAIEMYDNNDIERPFLVHSTKLADDYFKENIERISLHNFEDNFKGEYKPIPSYYRRKYDKNKTYTPLEYKRKLKIEADKLDMTIETYQLEQSIKKEVELLTISRQQKKPCFSTIDNVR